MKKPISKFALIPLLTLFCLQGCHVSQVAISTQVSCPTGGSSAGNCTVTVGATTTIVPNAVADTVGSDDLRSTTDGSYIVSASVPGSAFIADPNSTPTTTISVVTDTGYSSSITLSLTQVAPAISPINGGDVVYSYNLTDTPELDAWIQQVSANTISTMTLTNSSGLPVQFVGDPGDYTFTTVLTSNSTGTTAPSSVQVTYETPSGSGCGTGHQKCTDPGN